MKPGLYANIHKKRERIRKGSGEKMRKPGSKGAPTAKAFRESAVELRRLALKQWVGLTDEEINSVRYSRDWTADWTDTTFARAIEAKLREKNKW